jgi:sorbitol/mannitol transport system permease protein
MTRGSNLQRSVTRSLIGLFTWSIVIVFAFPVFWMVLTGFKKERDAATDPPHLFFTPTLDQYRAVFGRGAWSFLINSLTIDIGSTILVLALALPAAYALAIRPVPKWRDVLFFFMSTKMLPVAGAIVPIFIIAKNLHLLDTTYVLVIMYTAMNLPIAVWMLRSFLLEIPREILEAAQVDGAGWFRQLRTIIVPLTSPGLAATGLICFIYAWNEFFLAVNLTTIRAAPIPVFLVGFIAPEGQFWAKLCAAATVACVPVLAAGWAAQDKLVRGLSLGAIR